MTHVRKPPLDFSPMTGDEYREALSTLGLHISHSSPQAPGPSAARFFHIAPRTSRNYAAGDRRVPLPLAAFIRLLVSMGYEAPE